MLPDQLFYNTGIFTYIWLLRNEKPASHRGRVMLIDARQQFEKEPKSFGNKRNRMTDAHRAMDRGALPQWLEERLRRRAREAFHDREDFAYHKVSVVFWQTDEHDQPAIITEPYEKAFTAANLAKEQEFYDSDLTFRVRVKTDDRREDSRVHPQTGGQCQRRSSRRLWGIGRKSSPSNGRTGTTCRTTNTFRTARTSRRS